MRRHGATLKRSRRLGETGLVLYVGDPHIRGLEKLAPLLERLHLSLGAIYDPALVTTPTARNILRNYEIILTCNFSDPVAIVQTIKSIAHRLKAVVCRGGFNIASLQKLIPFVPYVKAPTVESLEWAMNKISTRQLLRAYDERLVPKSLTVMDAKPATVARVVSEVGLPAIVKPAGLAESMLIQIATCREELTRLLREMFESLQRVYLENHGHGDPMVLVEGFYDGKIYSVECFIDSKGTVYCCPLVLEVTGREAGFPDFFIYQHIAPAQLRSAEIKEAETTARHAIQALGLRSCTAHVELLDTRQGWKIIEVNPRIGGYREDLYRDVFGFSVSENDILIRMDLAPTIRRVVRGHSMILKIFARREGRIVSIRGTQRVRKVPSFQKLWLRKKVGANALFASHGGTSVLTIWLHHKSKVVLQADARRVEELVQIKVN